MDQNQKDDEKGTIEPPIPTNSGPVAGDLAAAERQMTAFWRGLSISEEQKRALEAFGNDEADERLALSRQIITKSVIDNTEDPDIRLGLAVEESQALLDGYATLDKNHRDDIARLKNDIADYIDDPTRKRPLNALMLAAPGAGKSHFIAKLAAALNDRHVHAVTFNMATMQSPDDMLHPIESLRNVKVRDHFPLFFLDEFDSDARWYATLLPLLWDGELHLGHRDLKLGKAVIVLAGSSPDLPKTMSQSATMLMNAETRGEVVPTGKLVDLLSRINGEVIEIPSLELRTKDRDRRVDKVCIAVLLLRNRFGPNLRRVPRSLLRFIAHTTFRYGVRSIAHLLDEIDPKSLENGLLRADKIGLPMVSEEKLQESSLRLHFLDLDGGFGVVNRWTAFTSDTGVFDLIN